MNNQHFKNSPLESLSLPVKFKRLKLRLKAMLASPNVPMERKNG